MGVRRRRSTERGSVCASHAWWASNTLLSSEALQQLMRSAARFWRFVIFSTCAACTSEAPAPAVSAAPTPAPTLAPTVAPSPTADLVADVMPPLLLDTRTEPSPSEVDPIVATVEALPPKFACATLSTRGRKLGKMPKRAADAYAKCKAALATPGSQDLRACLQLSELLRSAPRDEVLRDNINARACARGSQRACRGLAESRLGAGARFDPICAERMFEVLCEEGELKSCFRLGTLKLEGELAPEDVAAGRGLIQRACDKGEYMACLDVVMREKRQSETEARRIVEAAFDAASKACTEGEAEACNELSSAYAHAGQWYYLAKPAEDEAKQLELKQRACVLGSVDACSGLTQQERTDVYKDQCDEEPEACGAGNQAEDETLREDWYFRSCAAGWDSSCDGLTRISRRKSETTAARAKERGSWLEAGCLGGAAGACRVLSMGTVVPPSEKVTQTGCDLGLAASCEKLAQAAEALGDRVKQLNYLERACPAVSAQGRASTSRAACRAAGVMYKDGVGAAQDLGRAAILLQKGCVERRYVQEGEACLLLGTMYEDGVGVEKSLLRALDLYAAGCADESYQAQGRSRAEWRRRQHGEPAPSSTPPQEESKACARLHQWVKPKSTSSGGP